MADTRYVTHDTWKSLTATQVTYPNGRQVASGYDALYRRNAVTETSGGASIAQWQFFGNRTATTALGNGLTCSMMNNAGTHSAVQPGVPNPPWGDNTTDRLGYDGSGRLIAKRFLPPSSTTSLVGFATAYDPSSNKLYERALQAESRSALYPQYDSMDRLREYQRGSLAFNGGSIATPIGLAGTDTTRSYDLDGLGNWKKTVYTPEGGSPTTEIRQHNKLNEVTQVASTPVLYDHGNNAASSNPLIAQRGNGNITDDGTRLYAYDALNRLVSVTRKSDNAQVAAYVYDTLGRRAHKIVTNGGISGTVANTTSRYIYDGQQIAEELDGSNSTVRQFIWGQYIDELVQMKTYVSTGSQPLAAGVYYPLQDLLYRTAALIDSSHAIVEAYDYDAYGNTLMFKSPVGTDWWADTAATTLQPACEFLFTGRRYDSETEIYWYRARYYHPTLGRFLERDAIAYGIVLNLYEYVESSATRFLDAFGLAPQEMPASQWYSKWLKDHGIPAGPFVADKVTPVIKRGCVGITCVNLGIPDQDTWPDTSNCYRNLAEAAFRLSQMDKDCTCKGKKNADRGNQSLGDLRFKVRVSDIAEWQGDKEGHYPDFDKEVFCVACEDWQFLGLNGKPIYFKKPKK